MAFHFFHRYEDLQAMDPNEWTVRIRPRWERVLLVPFVAYDLWALGHFSYALCLRMAWSVAWA
jgi:hypothetical protein